MATADEYAAWIVQNADKKGTPEFDTVAKAYALAKREETPVTAQDRAQAAASGVNRGVLVNLAGLPVSTALNVWDLAKAYAGIHVGQATGKAPPEIFELSDRSRYVGSPEWISQKMQSAGAGPVINANRPDDEASRLLHAGGQGAGMALAAPQTAPQAVTSALIGAGSTAASQYAADKGLPPAAQAAAGLVLPLATGAVLSRAQRSNVKAQQEAVDQQTRRENFKETREAGFVYPPAQTRPNLVNRLASGTSGNAQLDRAAAVKDQPIVTRLAREDLQLRADVPLAAETFPKLRKDAAAYGYEPVKQFGWMAPDRDYYKAVTVLQKKYETGAGPFERQRVPAAEALLADARNAMWGGIDSNEAVSAIQRFREDASIAFKSGTGDALQVAHVQRGLADALEGLVGRNLQQAGQTSAFRNFQEARQLMAKSYNYENAFDPATGMIDARKMHSMWKADEPLTGKALTIAKHGGLSKQAANPNLANQPPPSMSVVDLYLAFGPAVAGMLAGHPEMAALAALPAARMGVRAGLLTGPYQSLMAKPPTGGPSFINRGLAAAPLSPATNPLLAAEFADLIRRRQLAPPYAAEGAGLFGAYPLAQ